MFIQGGIILIKKVNMYIDRFAATILYLAILLILLTTKASNLTISKLIMYLGIIVVLRHLINLVSDDLMRLKNKKKDKEVKVEKISIRVCKYIMVTIITAALTIGYLNIYKEIIFLYSNNKLDFERYSEKVIDLDIESQSNDEKVILHLKRVAYKNNSVKIHGYIENFTDKVLTIDNDNFYIRLNNGDILGIGGKFNEEFSKEIQPGKTAEFIMKSRHKELGIGSKFEVYGILTNADNKPFEGEKITFSIE